MTNYKGEVEMPKLWWLAVGLLSLPFIAGFVFLGVTIHAGGGWTALLQFGAWVVGVVAFALLFLFVVAPDIIAPNWWARSTHKRD